MNITVTDREKCTKELRIEIPNSTVHQETDKIAAQLAKNVNVPGFRRGHVPKSVVKTRFRKELRDEMLAHLLPESLQSAVEEKKLNVIGEPHVKDLKFGDDESIDVTFTVEVAPEFTLSNYKGISITKNEYKIGDDDVDKAIQHLRESQAELAPVEDRASKAGDIVTVNLNGVIAASDEQKAEEITQDEVNVELGAPGVLKEFGEALTDVKPGDKKQFSITYPEDHKPEKYAGRSVDYTAEVVSLRKKEIPELNEEFATSVKEEFKTVDDLKTDVRSKLEAQATQRTDTEFRNAVLEQLVDRNRFDVPEFVVNQQIDSRMRSLFREMAGRGMDPRALNLDWESFRESQRERAEREVRSSFIMNRIAEQENIEVSDEELSAEIKEIAESIGQTEDVLRARLTKEERLDSISAQVKHRKALDLVINSAEIRIEQKQGLGANEAAVGESVSE